MLIEIKCYQQVIKLLNLSAVTNVNQVVNDIVTVERQVYQIAINAMPYYVLYDNYIKNSSLYILTIDHLKKKFPFVSSLQCTVILFIYKIGILFQLDWIAYFQSALSQVNIKTDFLPKKWANY